MPVLTRPSLSANENSSYLTRTAPAAAHGVNADPSEKQVDYICRLLDARDTSDADRALQGLIDAFGNRTLSRGNASKLITALQGRPSRQVPVQTALPIAAPAPRPRPEMVEPGYYRMDGQFYKVQTSRGSGRNYSMLWDGERWDYESGKRAYRSLTAAMALSAEDAKAFGDQYHACIFCAQELTDQRSIDAGYGPTCAGNRGLPWG